MKKEKYSRKGFTLVELLIVIVVIGILSAMMMLSATEAMSSARAANIANSLRMLKTITLHWYTDNLDKVITVGGPNTAGKIKQNENDTTGSSIQHFTAAALGLDKYVGHGEIIMAAKADTSLSKQPGSYGVFDAGNDHRDTWYVGYSFTESEKNTVREKLRGRLKSLGLHFASPYPQSTDGEDCIWLKVRGEWTVPTK